MCEKIQNQEELRQKAMEHDMSDVQELDLKEVGQAVEEGAVSAYQKIEKGVVGGYQKIEDAVVGGYRKIEEGVVEGFTKMMDQFVEKLFAREGESVEDAKKRLNGGMQDKEQ